MFVETRRIRLCVAEGVVDRSTLVLQLLKL